MRLSETYQKRKQEGQREGFEKGFERGQASVFRKAIATLLRTRFGELDDRLSALIEPMLKLPPEEFVPLLMYRSREELLAEFAQEA